MSKNIAEKRRDGAKPLLPTVVDFTLESETKQPRAQMTKRKEVNQTI